MTIDHIKKQTASYYHKAKEHAHSYLIKKYFFIGVVGGILFAWRLQSGSTTPITSVSEYTAVLWTIQNTIEAYGSIQLVDEQKIRFNQQGEVTKVYFKKWSDIKKWDIIAELDQNSVQSSILQSEINLQNARLQLDETLNGDRSAQILQAENNLEQSKLKLNIAQQEYDTLSWDLNNSGTISDTETTLANTRLDIQNYNIEWEKIINRIDTIFWATESYKQYNDTFEIYISAKNSQYKNTTDSSILLVYNRLNILNTYYNSQLNSGTIDKTQLLEWLNLAMNLYEAIYATTSNAYSALNNSVVGVDLTQNMLDGYISEISSDSAKAKSSLSTILNSKNQITKLWSTETDTITLESKTNEIANLKNTIIIQEKTLETTKNWTSEQQLQIARNNIRQKELALEQTKKDLDSLQIVAPFDGMLRKIDFKVGDKVTSSDEKYVYLENPNLVEVSILLDQIDVVNVKPGMKVEVILDAYPGEIFEGILGDIDSTPTTTNGVVSYTVKVSIDKWTKIMYSWMTASVKIIIENKENVIVIPTTYIQSQWDIKYVLNENSNQVNIEVGATDGTMTEVVSGLTQGMTIAKIIKTSTSTSNSSSSFGMPGMWGSAMWGGRPD